MSHNESPLNLNHRGCAVNVRDCRWKRSTHVFHETLLAEDSCRLQIHLLRAASVCSSIRLAATDQTLQEFRVLLLRVLQLCILVSLDPGEQECREPSLLRRDRIHLFLSLLPGQPAFLLSVETSCTEWRGKCGRVRERSPSIQRDRLSSSNGVQEEKRTLSLRLRTSRVQIPVLLTIVCVPCRDYSGGQQRQTHRRG